MCTKLFSNFSKRTMSQIPQEQHEQNSMMDSDTEADTKEKKKTFCKRNLKIAGVLFVFMSVILTLLLCLILKAVPKITVEKPEKNKNLSIPKETKGIKFSDLSNKITIPQTSGCLIIQATITTKNSTLVHVHGTVNDGDIPYEGKYSCNRSCSIKMRIEENLIGGKAITVKVKSKGVIVSLDANIHFLPTERNQKPQHQTEEIEFSDLSNKITIPQTSGCLIIQATITTKNSTLVHVHGTVNDGDIPYGGKYSCNQSCSIKMRIEENLIGGKAITMKVKPKGVIVSLRGIMYFGHGSCNGEKTTFWKITKRKSEVAKSRK